ncbi:MAG: kelch repeat-containing protein, partial [candidate division WOR-3 bacterium]
MRRNYLRAVGAMLMLGLLAAVPAFAVSTPNAAAFCVDPTAVPSEVARPAVQPVDDPVWEAIAAPSSDADRLTHASAWDPVNDMIYMYGGTPNGNSGSNLAYLDMYNPNTNSWTRMAPMGTACGWLDGAYCRGKLYRMGGYSNSGSAIQTAEAYDIATNTWSTIAQLPGGQLAYGAFVYRDSLIYVCGGAGSGLSGSQTVYIYDTYTGTWTNGTQMSNYCEMFDA